MVFSGVLRSLVACYGVAVGSGIGGDPYEKNIFHGASGFASELGHTIAVLGGEQCIADLRMPGSLCLWMNQTSIAKGKIPRAGRSRMISRSKNHYEASCG